MRPFLLAVIPMALIAAPGSGSAQTISVPYVDPCYPAIWGSRTDASGTRFFLRMQNLCGGLITSNMYFQAAYLGLVGPGGWVGLRDIEVSTSGGAQYVHTGEANVTGEEIVIPDAYDYYPNHRGAGEPGGSLIEVSSGRTIHQGIAGCDVPADDIAGQPIVDFYQTCPGGWVTLSFSGPANMSVSNLGVHLEDAYGPYLLAPEPAAFWLMLTGLLGLAGAAMMRNHRWA